ncbi:MAG: O-antigen ligase family protein [Pirellulales bacterium]
MDFAFFILLNAVLFIRPSEIIPDLATVPIYEIVILVCLTLTFRRIIGQLSMKSLVSRPVSLFVVGVWVAVILSMLFGMFWLTGAKNAGMEFGKTVLYYLLLVAVVDTVPRLRNFLLSLCILTGAVCGIAVLEYHQVIDIPGLSVLEQNAVDPKTGETIVIPRIRATGIFGDPNDLSMLTVLGMTLAAYGLAVPRWRPYLPLWLGAIALFVYTLVLTHSRGGLLAFLIGSIVLFQSRFGWQRAVPLIACALPLALLIFSERQTEFAGAMSEGTGQARIQFWREGLQLLRSKPIFGIGHGQFAEEVRHVAHNSFVHAYTELGVFGGTLFLAAFAYPIWAIYRLGNSQHIDVLPPSLARLRPYLLAAIAGYAGAMLTLSRNYIVPTYLVLALAAVYLRLVQGDLPLPELKFDQRLARRLAFASVAFLAATYAFVRVFARWSG